MQTSCIIPCYNQAEYLDEAIKSCFAQTVPVEIVVVDDGSTDNTHDIIIKYSFNYNFKHLTQENKGLSAARNAGIKLATGVRILCLDADDTIEPTMIEKCQDIEGVAVVGVHNFGDRPEAHVLPYQDLSLEAFKVQNRITCCSMFDKKDWEAVGGFDENMKNGREDWDFWLSLLERDVKFTAINEYLFNYRMHGEGMAQKADAKQTEIHNYIKEKHKWKEQQ